MLLPCFWTFRDTAFFSGRVKTLIRHIGPFLCSLCLGVTDSREGLKSSFGYPGLKER